MAALEWKLPLQYFEVYEMYLENVLLWKMKTQTGWGREAGPPAINCCNTVLPGAAAASRSLSTSLGAEALAG